MARSRVPASIRMNRSAWIARRFARSLRHERFARFTTVVSIAAVALGCLALLLAMSVLRGYENTIEDVALRFTSHIEVRPRYGDAPIFSSHDISSALASVGGIAERVDLLWREGLGRTRAGIEGVVVQGLDRRRTPRSLTPLLVSGRIPQPSASTMEAVIGQELAHRLALHVGDTMVIFTSDDVRASMPTPRVMSVRICGVVRTGMQQEDETVVGMDIEALRTALHLGPTDVSAVGLNCIERDDVDAIAQEIGAHLPPNRIALTFRQRHYAMSSWIELQKQPIPIVLGLISIVAVFTVIASLLIAVVEKTRSVAILMTLGMPPRQIAQIFLWQGLRIGIVGCLLGCGLAATLILVQRTFHVITLNGAIYYVSELPVAFTAQPFCIVAGTSLALCLLASLVPTILAVRVSPVRVLRFE